MTAASVIDADTRPRRFLRRAAVREMTGLSDSSLYRAMREGTFPKPAPLGRQSVGWLESEIIDWQNRRLAERDGDA